MLTDAVLYIEAHEYKGGSATFDLLDAEGKIKYITFQPGKNYQFRLKYEHSDRLKKVFVISSRGGVRKLLEAAWDEEAGAYVTRGYFDGDSSYVPGNLSVEYIMKEDQSSLPEDGAFVLSNKEQAGIPSKWKTAAVRENAETASDYEAEIVLGNGDKVTYSYDRMSFTEFADCLKREYIEGSGSTTVAGSFLGVPGKSSGSSNKPPMTQSDISDLIDILEATGDDGEEYADAYGILKSFGFAEYITGEADLGKDLGALIRFDYSAEDIVTYIVDPSSCDNNILKYVVKKPKDEFKKTIVEMMGDKSAGNFLYSIGGNMFEFGEASINLLQARTEILADPSLTEIQRQAKLAQLDQMRDIACGKLVMQYLSAGLMVAGALSSGTGIGVAAVILSKVLDHCIIPMIESGDFDRFLQGDISLKTLVIRWIMDPSGYVYEGVASNRLGGVKATLFYKENENSSEEIFWDAGEYDQDNPLYTDENGCYAWDVPEGYWRVKYEKAGYETTYSAWMPVPPPQTDVNIAMAPVAAAKVESAHAYETYAVIRFDQYVDPATVFDIRLSDSKNNPITYEVSYSKAETDEEGTVYAKTFALIYKNKEIKEKDGLKVTVPEEVTSSGGKPVQSYTSEIKAQRDISMVICSTVHVKRGESVEVPFQAPGARNTEVSVKMENPDLAGLVNVRKKDEENGSITIEGKAYGWTRMRAALENTGIEKIVDIKVDTYSSFETSGGPEEPDKPKPGEPGLPKPNLGKPGPSKPSPGKPGTSKPVIKKPGSGSAPAKKTFASGATEETKLGRYQVISAKKKTARLISVKKKKATKLVVPTTVKICGITCKVTEVGANVMKGNTRLTKAVLGKHVVTIGKRAFYGCKKLKTVEAKGKLKAIKSGAFKNTSKKLSIRAKKLTKKQKRELLRKLRKAGNKKGIVT